MSKSVNYVREKKIPALLNDMVVHLLSTKSSDVIDSLIHYLEKHPDAAGHKSEPPKAKAAPPPAAHSTHAAASQPAAAADGHHDKKEEQHAHTPHKPTPPAGEHSHRPVPAAVAAAQTKTEEQAPLPTPAETEKAAQHLLDELVSSEKELAYLLAKAFDSEHLSQEERTLVATAASQNAELIKMTAQSDFTHTQVGVALERVRSEMTDTEFYASKGFRLIHDIETNERSVRALFHNIDIDSLRADEGELALQAIRMHSDFLALVDTIEEHQLQIAVKANGGAVNHSVATYFTNLSDALSQVCIDLRSNTASLKSRVPVEAVKNVDAKKVPPKAKSLTAQTNALVSAIKEQETHFLKTIAALNAGDDVELQALLNDAVRNAKELETIAAEVATTSNDVNVGGDNPHLSYDDLRKKIHGLNERVGVKMLLVHKAHTSAISRVTASLTAKAKDDASEITKSVTAALAPHESIPEVKEALAAQKELEKLVSEIDTLQQIISSHNAGH